MIKILKKLWEQSIFTRPRHLNQAGVVGLNTRNLHFIQRKNPRKYFPQVDSKIQSKLLATEANIPVPELYAIIESYSQVKEVLSQMSKRESFVIKPEHGAGGEGILLLNQKQGLFYRLSGEEVPASIVRQHINNILSGLYSLGSHPDRALLEAKVNFKKSLSRFCYQGTSDIRVIVIDGNPVMAMMRLPTKESDNKANLHQGAIGVGLNIETGEATSAIQNNRLINRHPDTQLDLKEIKIEEWSQILSYAKACYPVFNLGYLGVDLVLDEEFGPLLLEVNARPGLSVQIANQKGLKQAIRDSEKRLL